MITRIASVAMSLILLGCINKKAGESSVHVEIRKTGEGYQFYINDSPFEVNGVGMGNYKYKLLKESGGTAFRTWSTTHGQAVLDSAKKYGLMVAMGLGMGQELHHFDYNDTATVAAQLEEIKKSVDALKNHPNLLCWVAGNELNLRLDGQPINPNIYVALKDVVDYIHANDPNHPVTTAFAGANKEHIDLALMHCPDLDFLSFQVYGGLGGIPQAVESAGVTKPYAVTEYGPIGHWERPTTAWGREIEEPSGEKARGFAARIQTGLSDGQCLGGFAFVWGQKQERTPTWYGMFLPTGEATSTVDELTHYWTGQYPANRAPGVDSMLVNEKNATESIYLKPGQYYPARVYVTDPENDSLKFDWVMMREVEERSAGGAFEKEPGRVEFEITETNPGMIQFLAPMDTGEYRLFSYVYDGQGKAGTANIPVYVK